MTFKINDIQKNNNNDNENNNKNNKDILEDKETALISDISKNLCPQNVPVF